MAFSFLRFLDHTQRRITVGRTPLDEWSARRRDLYLTTRNNHNRRTSMPPVGFEPTISAGVRPQTYALDRAATGIGKLLFYRYTYRNNANLWRYSLKSQISNSVCKFLFQSNDKFQDERLFWFECRQKQGTYLPQSAQTSCDARPSSVRWVTQTSSPGLQGLRHKYDHSPPLSAEDKLSSILHHGVHKNWSLVVVVIFGR